MAEERYLHFDVWAFDDLTGASIGTLTEATDKHIHAVDNQPGSGSFRINRNSDEFALCSTDNLVRVRMDSTTAAGTPLDYDDTNYIFAFFIEEGQDEIVSVDEEGGEVVSLSGRSAEVILERAVIDWEAHYADDIVNHPYDRTALKDGQWHFDEAISGSYANIGAPGGVLRVLLRNAGAQVPEPIPEVTHDFTINDDSSNNAWEDGTGRFDLDVGMDLLSALMALVEGGLWYRFSPALNLSAWDASQGNDLSGSITIEKGVNVRESGAREIHGSKAKSRALVKGSKKKGGFKYRWVTETDADDNHDDTAGGAIEGEIGVRQGFVDYPYSPTNSRLNKAGRKFLNDAKNWHDGPPTVGVLNTTGQVAFEDYRPGDTVGLLLPELPAAAVVSAIDLVENDAGALDPILTFVAEPWQGQSPGTATVSGAQVEGGASYGSGQTPSDSPEITVDDGEVCLIWAVSNEGLGLVGTGTLVGSSDANFSYAYVNGPAVFTLSASGMGTNGAFMWVVVTGSGANNTGA